MLLTLILDGRTDASYYYGVSLSPRNTIYYWSLWDYVHWCRFFPALHLSDKSWQLFSLIKTKWTRNGCNVIKCTQFHAVLQWITYITEAFNFKWRKDGLFFKRTSCTGGGCDWFTLASTPTYTHIGIGTPYPNTLVWRSGLCWWMLTLKGEGKGDSCTYTDT